MTIDSDAEDIRRKLDEENNTTVSVALFGQPGAGKSSLINKMVGENVAPVGPDTDKTVEANWYKAKGLNFCDLPGYGTTNFPKETYFDKFDIPQFDLLLCVTNGKLHQADTEFFQELEKSRKVCIYVVNFHDNLWQEGYSISQLEEEKRKDISKHVGKHVKIIFTSCKDDTGIDGLIKEIDHNLVGAKKERWQRGAKAYSMSFLKEKKDACEKNVAYAAWAAAANGINPIPGIDIAIDLGVLASLFAQIRKDYGLTDDFLGNLKQSTIPLVGRLANNVVKYAAKEGILLLLRNFAGRQTIKAVAKYIPWVGQAIAAGVGYAITSNVGHSYLKDCHELAEEILKNKLHV